MQVFASLRLEAVLEASMRAVVFGCTGQDGSLLCRSLLHQGYEVIGVSRSCSSAPELHQHLGISESLRYVRVDLCDFRDVLELLTQHQPNEIYHLSAQSSVGLSFQEPAKTCQSIIDSTITLLEVVRYLGDPVRMFFAGSSEVFEPSLLPLSIASAMRPMSPYAIAKATAFHLVKLYRDVYSLECVTGVLFNHESPYRPTTFVTRKIINGALRCASDPDFRLQLGNLQVARDWGWAEEFVEAMQLLLRAEVLTDQLICTGRLVSLQYFVEEAFARVGLDWKHHVELQPSLLRPTDIPTSVGDPEPMANHTGWRASKDVDAVIDALLKAARTSV